MSYKYKRQLTSNQYETHKIIKDKSIWNTYLYQPLKYVICQYLFHHCIFSFIMCRLYNYIGFSKWRIRIYLTYDIFYHVLHGKVLLYNNNK